MSGAIIRKAVKDIACENWRWVAGRFSSFCNIDVTKVAEFNNGVSVRTLGAVMGAEEVRNGNVMTNEMSKAPSKNIYIDNHLVSYVSNSEMIT